MDYMVGIILISLIVAGLVGGVLLRARQRPRALGTDKRERKGSQTTSPQSVSRDSTGILLFDQQQSAPLSTPSQLASEARPPDYASHHSDLSSEIQESPFPDNPLLPTEPLARVEAEPSAETDHSESTSDSSNLPSAQSATLVNAVAPEADMAAAEPGQTVSAVGQVMPGDSEELPSKDQGVTCLTLTHFPFEAAAEGPLLAIGNSASTAAWLVATPATKTSIFPEAASTSVSSVLAATSEISGQSLCATPSSESEVAPKTEQDAEPVEVFGPSVNGAIPSNASELLSDPPQVADVPVKATRDFSDETRDKAGDSLSADVDETVGIAPSTVTVTQQTVSWERLSAADELAEDSELGGSMELQGAIALQPPEKPDGARAPRVYRPTPRAPSQGRNPRHVNGAGAESRSRALRVEIRVLFERGGFCRVSLLPKRDDSLPTEIEVKGESNPPPLLALQDEWFQDVCLDHIGDVLERGLVWQGKVTAIGTVRWNLSGRDIFVLGRRNDLSGYITVPRLLLGEEHVVLCTEMRLPAVLEALRATGSSEPSVLHADLGAPRGWVVLRGVTPRRPVLSTAEADTLDSLRPLADVEVVLLEGIRLSRTTWLAGYPPRIHLRGNVSEIGEVRIDGQAAVFGTDGHYETQGWDAIGTHEVWCPSASKSYTIQEGPEHWDAWDAYDWSLGESTTISATAPGCICGMLICPHDESARERITITVPTTHCVLIGSNPGEIYVCRQRTDLRASTQVAFPWFTPVWALPADSLHCNKRTTRVISLSCNEHSTSSSVLRVRGRSQAVMAWCKAILDAGRKGLAVEPTDNAAERLWREYRVAARAISRKRK